MLLLRPTTWPAAEGTSQPTVSEMAVPAAPSRSRHLAYEAAPTVEVDITTAEFLVSIGRGIGERDNIEIFEKLAEKLGATLSASRPLVDAGWLPAWRQVGQSGRTVKPRVYLAFGISGAVQHLAGMKQAGTIIAVNTDPDAAIFSVAHYGAVADLFDVADELDRRW
jgi:electron transfer flavoprotein alpha subunit